MIEYKKGYKYQLHKDYAVSIPIIGNEFKTRFFSLNSKGVLVIKAGYAWDGPSGPTIDTKSFMRGSLIHDVLYQAIRFGFLNFSYRQTADKILYYTCRDDGMWKPRAKIVYKAVKIFGSSSANPKNKKKVLRAP